MADSSLRPGLVWLCGGWIVGITTFVGGVALDSRSMRPSMSLVECVAGAMLLGLLFGLMAAQIHLTRIRENTDVRAIVSHMLFGLLGGAAFGWLFSGTLAGVVWNSPGPALLIGMVGAKWGKRRTG